MVSRPVLTPDAFSGEGSWDDWLDHFESVAEVNKWDNAAKLLWLRVRMTGRAQTAFKQLPEESRAEYPACIKGLRERFEPACKKELYLAEFQIRVKQKNETWAAFAEDLKTLTAKAIPTLQDDAREQLALTHYLGQLDNPQIAFNVKQKRPKTLDEAVSATLELQSYVLKPPRADGHSQAVNTIPDVSVVAGVKQSQDTMMQMLSKMMDRLDHLESERATPHSHRGTGARQRLTGDAPRRDNPSPRKPVVCHKCGKEGHFARGCAVRRSQPPGN